MSRVSKVRFTDYPRSIGRALDLIEAGRHLPRTGLIIIKPNLTNTSPPPVTIPASAVEAVYQYCRAHTNAEIVIGEGCGSGRTEEIFRKLGYNRLARRYGVELVDFNDSQTQLVHNDQALVLKRFHMPVIVRDAFVISLAVLKDHLFTGTTLALKNMFGIAPGKYYSGSWNKSKLHNPSTDKSVVDLCLYKKPEVSIIDATVGLKGSHLAGREVKLGLILASLDPVAVDTVGSKLLGHEPSQLQYLRLADGRLGWMSGIEIVEG